VAANLAIVLAQSRNRTLLVDADFRNGRLHELFGFSNTQGLTNILKEKRPDLTSEVLSKPAGLPDLYVLTKGSGAAAAPGLLYGDYLEQYFKTLRSQFENIIIDTPPAMDFADVRLLARIADGVALVIRFGTDEKEIEAVSERFSLDHSLILGTIVNTLPSTTPSPAPEAGSPKNRQRLGPLTIFGSASASNLQSNELV
jgi:Mrp family chromosome partitioning ATPase